MKPNSDTFFKDSGDLEVEMPAKRVRWIDFLTYSRLLNSKSDEKGWNSKTHWIKRGLEPLSKLEAVRTWTKNSVKNKKTYPRPREGNFNLTRKFSDNREKAAVECDRLSIDKCNENSLNSRLFQRFSGPSAPADSPFPEATLLAYEVPLCDDSDGQLKVDLLGLLRRKNSYNISVIELKQATSPSNSPLLALVECICYGLQIIRCQKQMIVEYNRIIKAKKMEDCNLINKFHFNSISLVIAAPENYWRYWECLEDSPKKKVREDMKSLIAAVNAGLKETTQLVLEDFVTIEQKHLGSSKST